MFRKLPFIVILLAGLAYSQAVLPSVWVDNNEATDGVNCGGFCTGLGYAAPLYEFQLGVAGGTWLAGPPACSGVFQALSTYTSTAVGKQAAITDIERCRTYGITHGNVQYCTILDVPPVSTQTAYSGPGSVPAGAYWFATGVTIPQTSNVVASCFNIVRSTQDVVLAAMSEPVCAGGIQDNLPTSANIGLINPDCTGNNLAYQLGSTLTPVTVAGVAGPGITFPFSLANGTPFTTLVNLKAAYNYVQYMYQDVCTSFSNCIPMQFCSVTSSSSLPCGGTTIGPDHWLFEDGAASPSIGNISANEIITTGSGSNTLASNSQMATHIHFRRYWAHGDWTTLAAGTNSITNGINLTGCLTCSVVGTQVSQVLRPGAEGHAIGASGSIYKFDLLWLEGQSSGAFSGGYSFTPFDSYVPFQNVQIGRVRFTYPYQWLGASSISNCNPLCGSMPNNNPFWGGAFPAWIVGPTMVTTVDGINLVWVSGDPFHDTNSQWLNNNVKVNGVSSSVLSLGAGTCSWPAGTGCPTTLKLKTSVGVQSTPVTFTMQPNNTVRKNCDEMKEGNQIVMYGVICENIDQSGGQNGTSLVVNVRNCSGGCIGQNYQSVISNLTILNSIFRNSCWGMEFAARSSSITGNGGGTSKAMRGVALLNDLQYNVTGTNPGCPGTKIGMSFASGGQVWQGTVTENSGGDHATFVGTYSVDASAPVSQSAITGTVQVTAGAVRTLTVTAANNFVSGELVTFRNTQESTLNGSQVKILGTGLSPTQFTADVTKLGMTDYSNPTDIGTVSGPAGFEVMNIAAGDPLAITGCTTTAFNVSTHVISGSPPVPVGIGAQPLNPLASAGTAAWTGTFSPGNVTVTYPWVATPNAVDNSGTCTITNVEGGPQNLILQHMTFVTDANQVIGNGNAPKGGGPNFQINHIFRDSIFLNSGAGAAGWDNTTVGEGTPTETFNYDFTTMTADHLVWPRRTASKYTFYGNNPLAPVASPVMYFPTGDYCPGATPTLNCIGFTGEAAHPTMSATSMPLVMNDYHNFALRSDSVFFAGNSEQASDGTSMGTDMSALDVSQTQNTFVCPSTCGSPGPFPDIAGGAPAPPVVFPPKEEVSKLRFPKRGPL